jgi:putative transcriptional regulator
MSVTKFGREKGLKEVLAYKKGAAEGYRVTAITVPEDVDVKVIRGKLALSQEQFAERFGFSVSTIRNWEQGHRQPDSAARLLLKIIERDPKYIAKHVESLLAAH